MVEAFIQVQRGSEVIADTTNTGGICEHLRIGGAAVAQVEDILRSTNKAGFDRGNRSVDLEMRISWQCATLTAALDMALRLRQNTPTIGDLVLLLTEGAVTYSASSAGAVWEGFSQR